jgi:hypothetical protein
MVVAQATQRYNAAADASATADGPAESPPAAIAARASNTEYPRQVLRDLNLNKPVKVLRLLRTCG